MARSVVFTSLYILAPYSKIKHEKQKQAFIWIFRKLYIFLRVVGTSKNKQRNALVPLLVQLALQKPG